MEGALTNAADLRERQMSHDSASGSDSEHEKAPGDTTENVDNKAASFARAFAKIISSAGTQKGILSVGPPNPTLTFDNCLMCVMHM